MQQTDVAERQQTKHWLFKPGQSGNPSGRPVGSRNKLEHDFLAALYEDFCEGGPQAIEECRTTDPVAYVKIIASLLPKDARIEINRSLTGLTPDELVAGLTLIRAAIEARDSVQGGPRDQAVIDVSPVSEAG